MIERDDEVPDTVAGEQGPDFDRRFAEEVKMDEVRAGLASELAPAGTYRTDPDEYGPLTVTTMDAEDGRFVIVLIGRARAEIRGETHETRLRVRLSPEARNRRDYETGEEQERLDLLTRLWNQAVQAYVRFVKAAPKTRMDVANWLAETPGVGFRVIQVGVPTKSRPEPDGDPDNLVVAIQAPRRG